MVTLSVAVVAMADDSPLVEASKQAKQRKSKPGVVITNATLAKTGGHVTTTFTHKADVQNRKQAKARRRAKESEKKSVASVAPSPPVTPPPVPPSPAADPDFCETEYCDPGNLTEPGIFAKVPDLIAAKPQFVAPKIVPPSPPAYTPTATPAATPGVPPVQTPPVTPQYSSPVPRPEKPRR